MSELEGADDLAPVAIWEDVTKDYGGRFRSIRALDGFSLEIEPAETITLLGANGSGKSTAVHLLLGLIQPTEGSVRLFDGDPTRAESRREVGFLPESFDAFPGATVEQLLRMFARLKELPPEKRDEVVEETTEWLSLDSIRHRRFASLSYGMRRRVGLAQAFLGDPEFLVLDEPTNGLDPETQQRFYRRLRSSDRTTVLLITHRIEEVRRLGGTVQYMEQGRIRERGPAEQILEEIS